MLADTTTPGAFWLAIGVTEQYVLPNAVDKAATSSSSGTWLSKSPRIAQLNDL